MSQPQLTLDFHMVSAAAPRILPYYTCSVCMYNKTSIGPSVLVLVPEMPRPSPISHVCQLEDTVVAEHGTVNVWFGSASQVTSPELSTTMYLNSTTVLGAKLTATSQSGLLEVYCEALRETASSVSQLPRAETSPELETMRVSTHVVWKQKDK